MGITAPSRSPEPAERLEVGVCIESSSLREQVCAALVAGGHVVHSRTAQVDALLEACNGTAPASVVLGMRRADRSAVSAVGQVRTELHGISVVLVCDRASGSEVRRGLELGIDGIVLSGDLNGALAPVVAATCAGQVSVPRGVRADVRAHVLTTREKQILGLVVMGLSNAEIARKLYLAESTVKSHLSSAFAKLGVSSRNEAVNVILDPERGRGLGILTIPAEPISKA